MVEQSISKIRLDVANVTSHDARRPLVLALDIGTSSVRAGLYDRFGRAVVGIESRRPHELDTTVEGAAVIDPDALLERVWTCLDETLDDAGSLAEEIVGVALCTFASSLLGLNDRGDVVTPLLTYADTRASEDAERLQNEVDASAVHERTGCYLHASYWPAQLRWLGRTHREQFDRVVRWMSIGDYVHHRLFSDASISHSTASWTGMLDRRRLVWDDVVLAALPIDVSHLLPLSDVRTPRRGLRPPYAIRWPALADVPWFPAVVDGAAANIGSGCVSPERVALTVGTTSAMRVVMTEVPERVPDGLWCYRVDGRRSVLGGALTEGGDVYEWFVETLRLEAYPAVEAALADMQPDTHGLTVLPFFAGERSPGWAGDARATIHGLTLATTPLDILRAGLEAVAYRLALVFERLRAELPEAPQIVASGGAVRHSPTWLQIATDVLNVPVALSTVEEASSRGAALLALEALGVIEDVGTAPSFLGAVYRPDGQRHARYREAIQRQQRLYEKLIETGHSGT